VNEEIVDLLGSVDLLRGLSKRQRRFLADRGRVIDHPAGKVITEEGTVAVGFHLITSGTATVRVGDERRPLKRGNYFGEISLIDGKPRSASVEAGEGLQTFCLMSWEFKPLLEEHPQIALELLTSMCHRLREAESRSAAN
jgi:CRP-like cAMP-binding protein